MRGGSGVGPDPDFSIGSYLARQRRLRGVSLDELAVLTRIPRRSLERLEDGAFDNQVDGFARGFVRTVAEALGLDAEEAVMRLIGEPPTSEDDRRPSWHQLRRLAVAGALLVGALAALVWVGTWLAGRHGASGDGAEVDIVYRRDVVRSLAARERASGPFSAPQASRSEPLDSGREEHPD